MAFIQISLYSKCLKRSVALNVLFPEHHAALGDGLVGRRRMPVLFLLHGFAGNQFDWVLGSEISKYANERNLMVVIPSCENHFYLDDVEMEEYWSVFVGEELPALVATIFGIALERETTWLGGYSMGGFGALRNGLKYHQRFGAIIALSSALIHRQVAGMVPGSRTEYASYAYYCRVFGEPKELMASDRNPEALAQVLVDQGAALPRIFLSCGTEDFLLAENRHFHDFLLSRSIGHEWTECPGAHDFDFWNREVKRAIEWAFGQVRG